MSGFLAGGGVGILTHFLVVPRYFDGYLHPLLSTISSAAAAVATHWHQSLAPHEHAVRNIVPFISSLTALLITPLVSLATSPPSRDMNELWRSFASPGELETRERDTFHLLPSSLSGRAAVALVAIGFATWAGGVASAARGFPAAGSVAVCGMIAVFIGGLIRVCVA